MMEKIRIGNVNKKQNGRDGWIMGNFKDHPLPYPFINKGFEIKWKKLKKGEQSEKVKPGGTSKTLCIVISGKQKITFPENEKSFILKEEGDYVFFEPGVSHFWEALTDNFTITIRWHETKSWELFWRWIVVIVLGMLGLPWGIWMAAGIFVLGAIIIGLLSLN